MPPAATKSKYGKNLQVLHFYPAPPQGHEMSVKCEEPLNELKVQVWLQYLHQNCNYLTLFVSGTELRTDKQTNGRTDDPITRCPRRTFQAGGIKKLKHSNLQFHECPHLYEMRHQILFFFSSQFFFFYFYEIFLHSDTCNCELIKAILKYNGFQYAAWTVLSTNI